MRDFKRHFVRPFSLAILLAFFASRESSAQESGAEDSGPTPQVFQRAAALAGPPASGKPVRVPLPRSVLAYAGRGLVGLRLWDQADREVPWVAYPEIASASNPQTFLFSVVSHESARERGRHTYVLEKPTGVKSCLRLVFDTRNLDFAKRVSVETSPDARTWTTVLTDLVFDFSSRIALRRTSLATPPLSERYLRVSLWDHALAKEEVKPDDWEGNGLPLPPPGDPEVPFQLDRISGWEGESREDRISLERAPAPSAGRERSVNRATEIRLGQYGPPLEQISIQTTTPGYFRNVEILAAQAEKPDAYRVITTGAIYLVPGMARAENILFCRLSPGVLVKLRILDQDHPPLKNVAVEAAWKKFNLFFIPEEGYGYRLTFDADRPLSSPARSLGNRVPHSYSALGKFVEWSVGKTGANPAYRSLDGTEPSWWSLHSSGALLALLLVVVLAGGGVVLYRFFSRAR